MFGRTYARSPHGRLWRRCEPLRVRHTLTTHTSTGEFPAHVDCSSRARWSLASRSRSRSLPSGSSPARRGLTSEALKSAATTPSPRPANSRRLRATKARAARLRSTVRGKCRPTKPMRRVRRRVRRMRPTSVSPRTRAGSRAARSPAHLRASASAAPPGSRASTAAAAPSACPRVTRASSASSV